MDERARLHAARRAQDMRALQMRACRFATTLAAAEEDRKAEALKAKRAEEENLFADWSAFLDMGAVDADAMRRLASTASLCAKAVGEAENHLAEASKERRRAAEAGGEAQLRHAQAAALLGALRRTQHRKRAEKMVRDVEDRFAAEAGKRNGRSL